MNTTDVKFLKKLEMHRIAEDKWRMAAVRDAMNDADLARLDISQMTSVGTKFLQPTGINC